MSADFTTHAAPPRATYEQSESIAELATALAAAQGEFGTLAKDKTVTIKTAKGPQYSFAYSDLASLLDMSRPVLSRHGIAVIQSPGRASLGGVHGIEVVTTLCHSSGQWLRGTIMISCDAEPRAIGSAISYARRYALMAMLGVAAEDDDAGAAGNGRRAAAKPTAPAPRCNKPSLLAAFQRVGVAASDVERYLGHSLEAITEDEEAQLVEIGQAIAKGADRTEFFGPSATERMAAEMEGGE